MCAKDETRSTEPFARTEPESSSSQVTRGREHSSRERSTDRPDPGRRSSADRALGPPSRRSGWERRVPLFSTLVDPAFRRRDGWDRRTVEMFPEEPSENGSTASQNGTPGEPSRSDLQKTVNVLAALEDGQMAVPVLIGPLTISGPGLQDSGGHHHRLHSVLSKRVGEEGFICTLFLDHASVVSIERHCGEAGSGGMVAVSFGVSSETLGLLTT